MKRGSQLSPIPNEVYERIGRLCSAWAYLELRTEQLIWGICEIDQIEGRDLTWRLNMRRRWDLVLERSPQKHDTADVALLSDLSCRIAVLAKDRDIVVHGLVHVKVRDPVTDGKKIAIGGVIDRVPAWTIFRGKDAGRNFPISAEAVRVIHENIKKTAEEVGRFNERHGYTLVTVPDDDIQQDWPIAL